MIKVCRKCSVTFEKMFQLLFLMVILLFEGINSITNIQYERILLYFDALLTRKFNKQLPSALFPKIGEGANGDVYGITPIDGEPEYEFIKNTVIKWVYYSDTNPRSSESVVHKYLLDHVYGYPEYVLKPYVSLKFIRARHYFNLNIYRYDDIVNTSSNVVSILKKRFLDVVKYNRGVLMIAMPKAKGDMRQLFRRNQVRLSLDFYKNIASNLLDFGYKYGIVLLDIKLDNIVMYNNETKFIDLDWICMPDSKRFEYANIILINQIFSCQNMHDKYDLTEFNFHAPELKIYGWNIEVETILSWNIGNILYEDLRHIYIKYYNNSYDMCADKNPAKCMAINIMRLVDPEWVTSIEGIDRYDILLKQILLSAIIPSPKNATHGYVNKNGGLYSFWNPIYRLTLSRLIDIITEKPKID